MKIALALSGGGFRATVFHLGMLARLAEENRLEDVTFLSTVSGGSLCGGLVFAKNDYIWPTSEQYINDVLPKIRETLTTQDLQKGLIWQLLLRFFEFYETRTDDLSRLMRAQWGITKNLSDLPEKPRWMINTTCYETGKNWRFERFRMGDYVFGYSNDTHQIPLTDAMAASAGFPGLIGPLVLDTTRHSWFEYNRRAKVLDSPEAHRERETSPITPAFREVHLWDGGVYDNLGLEGLHDFTHGWREDVDFLVVSDASGKAKPEEYKRGVKALTRIVTGVMMPQILSLRSRAVIERLVNHDDRGSFIQIGNSCDYILRRARIKERKAERETLCPQALKNDEVVQAAEFPTVIRRLTDEEFELLFRHGFEVADYTLYAFNEDFNYIGYSSSRWR